MDAGRLQVAKQCGADNTFLITSRDGKVVAEQILDEFGFADQTIECSGAESSIHTGIYVSDPLGKYVLILFQTKIQWTKLSCLTKVLTNILLMETFILQRAEKETKHLLR